MTYGLMDYKESSQKLEISSAYLEKCGFYELQLLFYLARKREKRPSELGNYFFIVAVACAYMSVIMSGDFENSPRDDLMFYSKT